LLTGRSQIQNPGHGVLVGSTASRLGRGLSSDRRGASGAWCRVMARRERGVRSDRRQTLRTPYLVADRASPPPARSQRGVCHRRFQCVAQRTDRRANLGIGCRLSRCRKGRHDGPPYAHRNVGRSISTRRGRRRACLMADAMSRGISSPAESVHRASLTGRPVARPRLLSPTRCMSDGAT
jgi:hypothetical protein